MSMTSKKRAAPHDASVDASTEAAASGSENEAPEPFNFYSLTVPQLKEVCRANGLAVGGRKALLLHRITNHDRPAVPDHIKQQAGNKRQKTGSGAGPSRRGTKSEKTVNTMLEKLGMDMSLARSNCCKKAIARGYLALEREAGDEAKLSPLDKVVKTVQCPSCSMSADCTIRELLQQPDCPGLDYEEGGEMAPIQCASGECGGIYVTRMCEGEFEADSGKFSQHCNECKGLGKCIGDYREAHCDGCGKHYFAGLSGFPCSNCYDEDGEPRMGFGYGGGRRRGRRGPDDCILM